MAARLVTCFTRYRRSVRLCLGISIRGISPNRRCHFRLTRWPRNSLPSVRSEIRVFSSDSSRRPSGPCVSLSGAGLNRSCPRSFDFVRVAHFAHKEKTPPHSLKIRCARSPRFFVLRRK